MKVVAHTVIGLALASNVIAGEPEKENRRVASQNLSFGDATLILFGAGQGPAR
jgi:hypothetical protein